MEIKDSISGAVPTTGSTAPPGALPGNPLTLLTEGLREHPRIEAGVFLLVDPEHATVEPAATWFASPPVGEAVTPALSRPYDLDHPGLVETALERGRPLLLTRVDSWEAAPLLRAQLEREIGRPADEIWEAFAHASLITCPVRTTLGRTIGLLAVASLDAARPLERADVYTVSALAGVAALARERSDLAAVEAARMREEVMLNRAGQATAASLQIPAVEQHVVDYAAVLMAADRAVLSRMPEGADRAVSVASAGGEGAGEPSGSVISEVSRLRSPHLDGTSLYVPVALGPRLFGVLSAFRPSGADFGDGEAELLGKLARSSAAAIANATDFEHERRVARALTRGFVPDSLPNLERWEVGLLYEPAAHQPAGGDVYGAWTLPGGAVGLLVGDVAGKGLETAAMSAMARFFIEARSWGSDRPAETLLQANTLLRERLPSDTFVTAFFGVLTSEGLRYANAGHPPPLLLRPRSEPEELPGRGFALGIDEQPEYEDHDLPLHPGDIVLAFTDGLVEARRGSELFGEERLKAVAADAAAPGVGMQALVGLVHHAVREWSGKVADDAALLALRHR